MSPEVALPEAQPPSVPPTLESEYPAFVVTPVGELRNTLGPSSLRAASPLNKVSMAVRSETEESIGFANAELPFDSQYDLEISEHGPNLEDGPSFSDNEFPWLFQDGSFFEVPDGAYLDFEDLSDFQEGFLNMAEGDALQALDQQQSMSHTDYQRLVLEFPGIAQVYQGDSSSMLQTFHLGLDYLDVCMPFFHRPTLNISSLPSLLILAVCSLGAITSIEHDAHNIGKLLHRHVRKRIVANVMDVPRVDVPTLQTMIVIEHVGFYALSRNDHELADVMHSMMVTLARRSNLLAQSFNDAVGQEQSVANRWKRWADHETLTRLAHCIFVDDLDNAIHFNHPSLLSTGDINVPLPCSPLLWQATTVGQWEEQMKQTRPKSRLRSTRSLQASLELLLPACDEPSRHQRRGALEGLRSCSFTMQVLIHAIASVVYDQNSRNAPPISPYPSRDYKDALAGWLSCFDQMNPADRTSEMARSALVTYHFVAIMLQQSLSNVVMAAGSAYANGHVVTSQRAQEAFVLLTSTKPLGNDAYRHALEIAGLCLVENTAPSPSFSRRDQPPSPLYVSYTAFLAVLVLWAYISGRSQAPSAASRRQHFLSRMMDSGQLLLTEPGLSGNGGDDGTMSGRSNSIGEDEHSLKQILDRDFGGSEMDDRELKATKREVCRLMYLVRDRLTNAHWEISLEARRMLDSLLARDFVE